MISKMNNGRDFASDFDNKVKKYLDDRNNLLLQKHLLDKIIILISVFSQDHIKKYGEYIIPSTDLENIQMNVVPKIFELIYEKKLSNYRIIRSYLKKMFTNKCYDYMRKNGQFRFLNFDDVFGTEELRLSTKDIPRGFSDADISETVIPYWQQALEKSSDQTRLIIESLSTGLTAELVLRKIGNPELSYSSTKQMIYRAKNSFRKTLYNVLLEALNQRKVNYVERDILQHIIRMIKKKGRLNSP